MESLIANDENGDRKSRIVASIAALDEFIESQKRSLNKLQDDTRRLEDLKGRAMLNPTGVLEEILGDPSEGYLKHSDASLELDTAIPELDWTVFDQAAVQSSTSKKPTSDPSSRANRIKAQIAEFAQMATALPALPVELIDNDVQPTGDKGKKRKRVNSTPRRTATSASLASSGGLRLPYTNDSLYAWPTMGAIQRPHKRNLLSTPSETITDTLHGYSTATETPLDATTQLSLDYGPPQKRAWASKGPGTFDRDTQLASDSPPDAIMSGPEPVPHAQIDDDATSPAQEEPTPEQPNEPEDVPATFKKNWSLEEQHTLERLLTEIPSTVKFRWVKISEAMGGTRTPRQVASRVQKYYEKMKKLGVAVDSADMGGGGRGGSKATQALDKPATTRAKSQSIRGTPKVGPQYTKSGRRR